MLQRASWTRPTRRSSRHLVELTLGLVLPTFAFDELNDRADLEAVLDALIALPAYALQSHRLSYYLDRFWWSLASKWQPEWVDKVAQLVVRCEEVGNPDDGDLQRDFVPAMQSLPDRGNAIGRRIVERLLAVGRDVHHLCHAIPALVGPDVARWLVGQPGAEDLIGTVRAFGPPETTVVLRGPITPWQQEQVDRRRREEERQQERSLQLERTIASLRRRRCLVSGTPTGGPSALAGSWCKSPWLVGNLRG